MTIKISVIRIIICMFDTQTVKVFESPAQHHHRTVLWNWAFWDGHYQEKLQRVHFCSYYMVNQGNLEGIGADNHILLSIYIPASFKNPFLIKKNVV